MRETRIPVVAAAVRGLIDIAIAIAFIAILATAGITLADILMRLASYLTIPVTGYRTSWAVTGVVDLSQLLVMAAASFAIAVTFFFGKHVSIDLIEAHLPRPGRLATAVLAAVLSAGFVAACLWAAFGDMQTQREMNTTSATLAIPYLYYSLPLLAGLALSVIAIIARFLGVRASEPSAPNSDDAGPPGAAGQFDV